MSDLTLLAKKNIETQRARSAEASPDQPAPSPSEAKSENTAAAEVLTDAIKPLATEYEKQAQELEDRAKDLQETAELITQQEKDIADAKVLHKEGETKLATAQNELKEEGAKQSAVAKTELGKIGEMVGKDNPALQEALGAVPAGLTEADVEMIVDNGIKTMAPDIAKNIVNPTAGYMSPSEEKRASDYARRFGGDASAAKVLEGIQAREKNVDEQKASRDKANKDTINSLVTNLPEGDKESVINSYTSGIDALEDPNTTPEQQTRIKSALGAEVGSTVKVSGRTFEVTGHKDGMLYLQGDDPETGGIVEQKVPYKNCRIESLADGTPLADRYEKTFNNQPVASETKSAGSPTSTSVDSANAPAPTNEVNDKYKWGAKNNEDSANAPTPTGGVENSSSTSEPTPERLQYTGPEPTTRAQTPAEREDGDRSQQAPGNPGEIPEPVGAEQADKDRAAWIKEKGISEDSGEDLADPRKFVPVEATGSVGSDSEEPVSLQKPESESKVDSSLGFDKVKGTKHGGNHIELDAKLSDGSKVSIFSDGEDGYRSISIGKNLTFEDQNAYHPTVKVELNPDGSIKKFYHQEDGSDVVGNERAKFLEELKKVGLTLPG